MKAKIFNKEYDLTEQQAAPTSEAELREKIEHALHREKPKVGRWYE